MTADKILEIARGELGTKESPPKSNKVKYNTWYYGRTVSGSAYPWCMVFVQWVFNQAGARALLPIRTASCGTLMTYAQRAGEWVTGDYKPGDVVIYDFPGGAATDHTGIIESATGDTVTAIEGNTSKNNASDGGEVCRMTRNIGTVRGAWRPKYEEDDDMSYEQFVQYYERYQTERRAQGASDWFVKEGLDQTPLTKKLFQGDEHGNMMWQDTVTREQLAAIVNRYDKA